MNSDAKPTVSFYETGEEDAVDYDDTQASYLFQPMRSRFESDTNASEGLCSFLASFLLNFLWMIR